jgi:hypothetical protein
MSDLHLDFEPPGMETYPIPYIGGHDEMVKRVKNETK